MHTKHCYHLFKILKRAWPVAISPVLKGHIQIPSQYCLLHGCFAETFACSTAERARELWNSGSKHHKDELKAKTVLLRWTFSLPWLSSLLSTSKIGGKDLAVMKHHTHGVAAKLESPQELFPVCCQSMPLLAWCHWSTTRRSTVRKNYRAAWLCHSQVLCHF